MKRQIAVVRRSTNRIAYAIFFLPTAPVLPVLFWLYRRAHVASLSGPCQPAANPLTFALQRSLPLDVEPHPQALDQRAQLRTARIDRGWPEEGPLDLPVAACGVELGHEDASDVNALALRVRGERPVDQRAQRFERDGTAADDGLLFQSNRHGRLLPKFNA